MRSLEKKLAPNLGHRRFGARDRDVAGQQAAHVQRQRALEPPAEGARGIRDRSDEQREQLVRSAFFCQIQEKIIVSDRLSIVYFHMLLEADTFGK